MILLIIFFCTYLSVNVQAGYGPEMYFHPLPDTYKKWLFWTVQPTLINYEVKNLDSQSSWTKKLDDFLEEYRNPTGNLYNCDYEHQSSSDGISCDVDVNSFGPCVKENLYGYRKGQPCIFLSLDKKKDWIPQFYNNISEIPHTMPSYLKAFVEHGLNKQRNNLWVSCEGETPTDIENIGPISFYPRAHFPGYYFPYKNQPNYLSPLIAVHFERITRGIVINVKCKAWAKNIEHCTENHLGTVSFELLID